MSAPPNLIINIAFNPPNVKIIGPIREETVNALNHALPAACTTDPRGRRPPATFQYSDTPIAHWHLQLYGNYCNEIGRMQLMLCIFDALEEEGGWQLKATHCLPMPDAEEHKFFFVRKQ
eukprot:TRINITY_DN12832_c0_g1_i1.p1 TRINITY_DN12832_c0_g1~~TRINITY_DN12832_c0_g1_i1.p1  ORF type:complete len:137 (-),score=73.01 TRINITY_DN12832_c0_g1_i1:56-412(-)